MCNHVSADLFWLLADLNGLVVDRWTAPVPMVKPEETIYLWNDEDLINHSATKRLELLSRVTSLDEETVELHTKLVAAAAAGSNVGSTEGYLRGGEEAPPAQPLTKRRSQMSVEDYEAAEVAAAEKIRQRLREIEEERTALPSEEDVIEAVKGELPPADPQTRPRSPSPSRKWKPPPPPQPEPEREAGVELGTGSGEEYSAIEAEGETSHGGWEQDDGRPETATGIVQAVAVGMEDCYPDPSGRQSPSFYTDEGELMVRLRWQITPSKHSVPSCSPHAGSSVSNCRHADVHRSRALMPPKSDGSTNSSWSSCWHLRSTKTCSQC